ncbi:MAG: hypothetical protein LBO75_04910 [Bifidobacteriaceae bacterium]|jgi:alternate signal-mediated exported protein|nr:hypothetical protein [Bifidobacteriaceae bacterium]
MKQDSNRRTNRVRGLIAGAAGVALLLGGSTFALWSVSDTKGDSTSVKAGSMSVTAGSEVTLYDVSADRANIDGDTETVTGRPGHAVTVADLDLAPQDTIAVALPFKVSVVGDNVVGKLSATLPTLNGDLADSLTIDTSATLFQKTGTSTWDSGTAVPVVNNQNIELGYYSSEEDKGENGVLPVPTDGDFRLVVFITFNDVATDIDMSSVADFKNLGIKLDQIRTNGKGHFVTPTP